MATFIDGVNRIMRINSIIKGDDDDITTFDDTQHAADIEIAQIAIQDEIGELVSDRLIGYERTSGTIELETSTRTYPLNANFTRFYGENPSFYDSTDNVRIYEYVGGESKLRDFDYQYQTTEGNPFWWYWVDTTTKTIGLYHVPSSAYNGRSLSYDYETSAMVTNSSDTLPLITTEEYHAFTGMAARRMKFMMTERPVGELTQDPTYKNAKARLYNFMRPTNPNRWYGKRYG